MKTSYLKAHPVGNRYPEWMANFPLCTVARIRTRVLGDLWAVLSTFLLFYFPLLACPVKPRVAGFFYSYQYKTHTTKPHTLL